MGTLHDRGNVKTYNMAIDLNPLASNFREMRNKFLATTTLRVERDPRLFAQLAPDTVPSLMCPLPSGLKVGNYEEDGLAWFEADCYSKTFTFTTPADLHSLSAA